MAETEKLSDAQIEIGLRRGEIAPNQVPPDWVAKRERYKQGRHDGWVEGLIFGLIFGVLGGIVLTFIFFFIFHF
jgi:hypothetical protein